MRDWGSLILERTQIRRTCGTESKAFERSNKTEHTDLPLSIEDDHCNGAWWRVKQIQLRNQDGNQTVHCGANCEKDCLSSILLTKESREIGQKLEGDERDWVVWE